MIRQSIHPQRVVLRVSAGSTLLSAWGTIGGPNGRESSLIHGNRIQLKRRFPSEYAAAADDCHAEGHGFESHQPLRRSPLPERVFRFQGTLGIARGDFSRSMRCAQFTYGVGPVPTRTPAGSYDSRQGGRRDADCWPLSVSTRRARRGTTGREADDRERQGPSRPGVRTTFPGDEFSCECRSYGHDDLDRQSPGR